VHHFTGGWSQREDFLGGSGYRELRETKKKKNRTILQLHRNLTYSGDALNKSRVKVEEKPAKRPTELQENALPKITKRETLQVSNSGGLIVQKKI